MSPRRSKYAHARYQNLYHYPDQPCWIYRRYSSEKDAEFYCSTALEAVERNAPAAYKIGVEKFNEWLGAFLPAEGTIYIRDLARAYLASKDDPNLSDHWYRCIKSVIDARIIPGAGHLKPIQITPEWWKTFCREERKKPRSLTLKDGTVKELPPVAKLFNTRKVLVGILGLAMERGLIEKVPELVLDDAEAEPPREIPKADILRIIRFAGRISAYDRTYRGNKTRPARESRYNIVPLKLLVFIMWKQGARPSEILQYRWEMIHWDEGKHGTIHVPAEIAKNRRSRVVSMNSKVARILRFLYQHKTSPWLFPSPKVPGERMQSWDTAWDTVMNRLGLDFTIYNLRDTFITNKIEEGLSPVSIGQYVDNSAVIIERKYAVAKRKTMEEVAG